MSKSQTDTPVAETPEPEQAAEVQAVEITGFAKVIHSLREVDEDAQALWKTKGPRGTTTEIGAVLFSPPDRKPEVLLVHVSSSGRSKVYREVSMTELTT